MNRLSEFERASFSDVALTAQGTVQKTMRHPFGSADAAEAYCTRLAVYNNELIEGPIAVAQFCGAATLLL